MVNRCRSRQQMPVNRLFIRQTDPRRRQRQKRGTTTGNQRDQQIIRPQSPRQFKNAARRRLSCRIGHRMRRLDNFDLPARNRMAVPRHHQPR